MVSTTDLSTPVVDDPHDWRRAATTRALSDVHAAGGTPLVALNLLCWPRTGELVPRGEHAVVIR